jgi:hypothetical protein
MLCKGMRLCPAYWTKARQKMPEPLDSGFLKNKEMKTAEGNAVRNPRRIFRP